VKQLNLSVNELWALLRRTFEALYGHERDYYDMARTVLWLECHGHDGVGQLIGALPHLENTKLGEPNISETSSGHYVIDGKGHSLLCIGRSICDLAMAYASENETSRIDIINVTDSKSLIGILTYAASQGFSAIAMCKDNLAVIAGDDRCPTLYKNNEDMLSLICSRMEETLSEYMGKGLDIYVRADTQKDSYACSLEQGVQIKRSHYEALTIIANRVLVEASEASRRGAGE